MADLALVVLVRWLLANAIVFCAIGLADALRDREAAPREGDDRPDGEGVRRGD